jgi:2-hydroxy-3-oxopropionate reductase
MTQVTMGQTGISQMGMDIAVLGTGLMGAPMARRLAAAGHRLRVWNRSAARAQALADVAEVCESPVQAAMGAQIVIAMLLDGPATREVLLEQGVLSAMERGAVLVDMGSVDPATDRDLAAQAQALGLAFLDAPVSGGVVGAEAGSLSIFVGGDPDVLARVAPVLKVMGRPTHLGAVGAGQATKLANQLIVATTIGAVAEGLRLAEAAGCDPASVRAALMGGFADSRILELHGARMVAGDYTPGGRSVAQLKDIVNALAVAQESGLDLPLANTVEAGFRDLVEQYDGADLDHSAYHHWLKVSGRVPEGKS